MSFAVYYGVDTSVWRRLGRPGTVVLAVEAWPERRLAALRARGARVLAYLSVGEAAPHLLGTVPSDAVLGINPRWGGGYLDLRREPVQAGVLDEAARLWARGIDGFLLDTVDVVDVFPRLRSGAASLLGEVRRRHPSAYLLMNRGFGVLSRVAAFLDGVLVEGCADRGYGPEERAWIESACRRVRGWRLDGYVLDYATHADPERSRALAARHGFEHYLAPDPRLDRLAS